MRLDGKQIVFNQTILASDGQRVEFEVRIRESDLPFILIFRSEQESETGIKVEITETENRLILHAINWTNPLGTALKEPVRIAEFQDKSGEHRYMIYCLMAHHKIGGMHMALLQILFDPLSVV